MVKYLQEFSKSFWYLLDEDKSDLAAARLKKLLENETAKSVSSAIILERMKRYKSKDKCACEFKDFLNKYADKFGSIKDVLVSSIP